MFFFIVCFSYIFTLIKCPGRIFKLKTEISIAWVLLIVLVWPQALPAASHWGLVLLYFNKLFFFCLLRRVLCGLIKISIVFFITFFRLNVEKQLRLLNAYPGCNARKKRSKKNLRLVKLTRILIVAAIKLTVLQLAV